MTHDELVAALRGILHAEGYDAPPPSLKAGDAVTCDICTLQYTVDTSGLCPNNNCLGHYRSYPEFRAKTGQIIASLEPMMGPQLTDVVPHPYEADDSL